jgi:hypothetical protein
VSHNHRQCTLGVRSTGMYVAGRASLGENQVHEGLTDARRHEGGRQRQSSAVNQDPDAEDRKR